MSNWYGALEPVSGDAGTWQLIEETEPGIWQPLARGGKQNIVALSIKLTGSVDAPMPPTAAASRERDDPQPAPAGGISYDEVMRWNQEEYLARRGQLFIRYQPAPETKSAPIYSDGKDGRVYSRAAAEIMTGPANRGINPWAPKPGERDRLAALAAAAEHLLAEWDAAGNVKRTAHVKDNVLNDWPALAAAVGALKLAAKP